MSDLIVDTKTYNLSTRSGSCVLLNDDYKSSIQFDIPDMIYKDDTVEYIQYSIPYCIVPVSFYQINETNNVLHFLINGQDLNIIFEYGNYNASYFMQQFKKLVGANNGWNISLETFNSKFTITNAIYPFTLYGDSSIDYVMGFSDTCSSSLVNSINTLTLARPCNFLSLPRICLRCHQLSNSGNMKGNTNSADIIVSIPNNARPNGQIVYENIYSKTHLKSERIERLNIQFTDDDGNLINFNGISSFFIIQFDIFRKNLEKPPPFGEIQKLVTSVLNEKNQLQENHFVYK